MKLVNNQDEKGEEITFCKLTFTESQWATFSKEKKNEKKI
jgi:hypothetical protein